MVGWQLSSYVNKENKNSLLRHLLVLKDLSTSSLEFLSFVLLNLNFVHHKYKTQKSWFKKCFSLDDINKLFKNVANELINSDPDLSTKVIELQKKKSQQVFFVEDFSAQYTAVALA